MIHDFRSRRGRLGAALGLVAACTAAGTAWADEAEQEGPSYTYLGLGYEWTDVKYAVRADGAAHSGYKLEASVGLTRWLHVYGEYFDGDFDDYSLASGDAFTGIDSTAFHVGVGFAYPITPAWDAVLRVAYVDSELSGALAPTGGGLVTGLVLDDDGYQFEGLVRGIISERAEVNFGFSYTEFDSSDISNSDVTVALLYGLTDTVQLKARGIIFDNDTGLELGVRVTFGDSLF